MVSKLQSMEHIISNREDKLVSRFRVALDASSAEQRDVVSLNNWIRGKASINREEASFLHKDQDLMSIRTLSCFQKSIVRAGVRFSRMLKKVRFWLHPLSEPCADDSSMAALPLKDRPETRGSISLEDRSSGVSAKSW